MKVNFVPVGLQKGKTIAPQQLDPEGNPIGPAPYNGPAYQSLEPAQRREDYARQVLAEGIDSSPTVGGWGEGLARMGKALVGGILTNRAEEGMKRTKADNRAALKGAFESGNLDDLLSSEDPVAQQVGASLLRQQAEKVGGKIDTLEDGTQVWLPEDGTRPTVLSRPHVVAPIIREGMISRDGGLTWEDIEGYTEKAKKLAEAKRAPPKPKVVKDVQKYPWE